MPPTGVKIYLVGTRNLYKIIHLIKFQSFEEENVGTFSIDKITELLLGKLTFGISRSQMPEYQF